VTRTAALQSYINTFNEYDRVYDCVCYREGERERDRMSVQWRGGLFSLSFWLARLRLFNECVCVCVYMLPHELAQVCVYF